MSDQPEHRCPHDGKKLRWMDDKWWCPKCKDEFSFEDDLKEEL